MTLLNGVDGADEATVDVVTSSAEDTSAEVNAIAGDDDDSTAIELVHVGEDFFYMAHVMRLAALLHSLVSLAMLVAYYNLKVSA